MRNGYIKIGWRKKALVGVVGICAFFASSIGIFAADDNTYLDPYIDGNLSIGRCISKGNIDFVLFLNAVSNFQGYTEAYEIIFDVLKKNQCQAGDINSLLKQRDKLRGRIRDAFLLCQNEKIPALKTGFYTVTAEIYYVRNVVQGKVILNLPYDLLTTRMAEDPDSLFYPRDKLYSEMYDKYVNSGKFEKLEFDILFDKLETKYGQRKEDYVICGNSSWDIVAEKWAEFIETAGGVGPAADNFEDAVGGRAEKISEAARDEGFTEYITGIAQLNVNNLEPEAGFSEIFDRLADSVPAYDTPGTSTPTQDSFLSALIAEGKRYDTLAMKQQMLSNFSSLYKDSGDASIEVFVLEIEKLNQVIKNSYRPLEAIVSCAFKMNLRQCPGK